MRPTAETLTSPTRADKELVATAKAGDEMSFQTLFKRHQTRIFALALRYTRIHEDAEDIVQQTFQKAFVHLPRFEGKSAFSTWLTRIAINESLMFLRRVRVLREIPIDDSSGDEGTERLTEPVDTALDPEEVFLVQERAQILTSALGRLKPATRQALELLELRELSTAETARHLGVSVGAVKARVFHGRRKLRRMLRGCMGLPPKIAWPAMDATKDPQVQSSPISARSDRRPNAKCCLPAGPRSHLASCKVGRNGSIDTLSTCGQRGTATLRFDPLDSTTYKIA